MCHQAGDGVRGLVTSLPAGHALRRRWKTFSIFLQHPSQRAVFKRKSLPVLSADSHCGLFFLSLVSHFLSRLEGISPVLQVTQVCSKFQLIVFGGPITRVVCSCHSTRLVHALAAARARFNTSRMQDHHCDTSWTGSTKHLDPFGGVPLGSGLFFPTLFLDPGWTSNEWRRVTSTFMTSVQNAVCWFPLALWSIYRADIAAS
ncbi:hypothetical protein EV363DRAFT_808670 [Boletus edulis]|nr:hypothetical protein EV363DRAFT_808670 [Boletus edulis]